MKVLGFPRAAVCLSEAWRRENVTGKPMPGPDYLSGACGQTGTYGQNLCP